MFAMPRDTTSKSRSKAFRSSSPHDKASSRHKSHGQSSNSSAPLSFLFVVNEVSTASREADSWGNPRPPTSTTAYYNEVPSIVMRYRDGLVEPAGHNFIWNRGNDRDAGIWCHDQYGKWFPVETYRTATIFSCHPLMPFAMVRSDAMRDETYTRDAGDGMSSHTWQPLLFFFPLDQNGRVSGVSRAMFDCDLTDDHEGGGLVPYVAGQAPTWMPSLVPKTYQNSTPSQPSRGLQGELTILLGLMTFSAAKTPGTSRAEGVFLEPNGRWRRNRWHYNHHPEGYTKSILDLPQGLIITVALDPLNPQGSTDEALWAFEFEQTPVKESSQN